MVKFTINSGDTIDPFYINLGWRLRADGDTLIYEYCDYGMYTPSEFCTPSPDDDHGTDPKWTWVISPDGKTLELKYGDTSVKCWMATGIVIRWQFDVCCNNKITLEAVLKDGTIVEFECFRVPLVSTVLTDLCNCRSYEGKPAELYLESLCCLEGHFTNVVNKLSPKCQCDCTYESECGSSYDKTKLSLFNKTVLEQVKVLLKILEKLKGSLQHDINLQLCEPSNGTETLIDLFCLHLVKTKAFVVWNYKQERITSFEELVCVKYFGIYLTHPCLCGLLAKHLTECFQPPPPLECAGCYCPVCPRDDPVVLKGSPPGGTFSGEGVETRTTPDLTYQVFNPAAVPSGQTYILTYSFVDSWGRLKEVTSTIEVLDPTNSNCRRHLPSGKIEFTPPVCTTSNPIQLVASPPGGTWSGTNVSPTGIFTPNGLAPGMYGFCYTYQDPQYDNEERKLRSMIIVRDCA